MKILYGVVGEGTGHAIRSRVVLSHLLDEGHEVEVMASAKAAEYLAARFDNVHRIHGLHLITARNQVRLGRTLLSNLLRGAAALPRQIASYFELIADFAPQMVISDFESWTYTFAKTHNLPIVSIDNMQVIHRCRHDADILRGQRAAYEVTRSLVQGKLMRAIPRCAENPPSGVDRSPRGERLSSAGSPPPGRLPASAPRGPRTPSPG
jgi:uncharacterized protein (TIGR00661 family)